MGAWGHGAGGHRIRHGGMGWTRHAGCGWCARLVPPVRLNLAWPPLGQGSGRASAAGGAAPRADCQAWRPCLGTHLRYCTCRSTVGQDSRQRPKSALAASMSPPGPSSASVYRVHTGACSVARGMQWERSRGPAAGPPPPLQLPCTPVPTHQVARTGLRLSVPGLLHTTRSAPVCTSSQPTPLTRTHAPQRAARPAPPRTPTARHLRWAAP